MDYAGAYGEMHENEKRFPGYSLGAYVESIATLIRTHEPQRLLDYGSGKGYQYLVRRYHERWGGLLPFCFDVGVRQLSAKPEGQFGGVICTDMLEHIEEGDLPAIMDDLIGSVADEGFLFLGISCRPSRKTLPDGRDVHVTVQRPSWWALIISEAMTRANRPEAITIRAEFDLGDPPHFDGDNPKVWISGVGFRG